MKCRVTRDAQDNVIAVYTPKGKPSLLYQELKKSNTEAMALRKYAFAMSDGMMDKYEDSEMSPEGEPSIQAFIRVMALPEVSMLNFNADDMLMDSAKTVNAKDNMVKQRNAMERMRERAKMIQNLIRKEKDPKKKEALYSLLNKVGTLRDSFRTEYRNLRKYPDGIVPLAEIYKIGIDQFKDLDKLVDRAIDSGGIELEEVEIISNIVSFWNQASNFQAGYNPFLTSVEQKADPEVQQVLNELKAYADRIYGKVAEYKVSTLLNRVNNMPLISRELTEAMLTDPVKDINAVQQFLLSSAEMTDPIAQLLAAFTDRMWLEVDEEYEEHMVELKGIVEELGGNVDAARFQQKDTLGRLTGNLISPYKAEFDRLVQDYDQKQDTPTFLSNRKLLKEHVSFLRIDMLAKLMYMDSQIQFGQPYDQGEYNKAKAIWEQSKAEFEKEYGVEEIAKTIEKVKDDINFHENSRYAELRVMINEVNGLALDPDKKAVEINIRQREIDNRYHSESPTAFVDQIYNYEPGPDTDYVEPYRGSRLYMPKSDVMRDSVYQGLNEAEIKLLNFFKKVTMDANHTLPFSSLPENFFPTISKQVLVNLNQGTHIPKSLKEKFISIATSVRYTEDNLEQDRIGFGLPRVKAKAMDITKTELNRLINQKKLEMQLKGEEPKSDRELEKDIRDELAKDYQSWDMLAVLSFYILNNSLFKARSKYESSVRLAYGLGLERSGIQTDNMGEPVQTGTDIFGKPIFDTASIPYKLVKVMHTSLLSDYFGLNLKQQFGALDWKLYNKEDREKKLQLETLLNELEEKRQRGEVTDEDFKKLKDQTEEHLEELGDNVTLSGLGDVGLYYNQLRGMGWNIFSAVSTLFYGTISNEVHVGRYYTAEGLERGQKIARNASIRKLEGKNPKEGSILYDIMRIKSLDRIYKLVESPTDVETHLNTKSRTSKLKDKIKPMGMQEGAEFFSQIQVAVAVLHDAKVTVKLEDGSEKEISFLDGFDANGLWKYDAESKEQRLPILRKAIRTTRAIHGNYGTRSSNEAQKTFVGRALLQFRKWGIAAFTDRFGGAGGNLALDKDQVKGRYISFFNLYKYRKSRKTMQNLKEKGDFEGKIPEGGILNALGRQLMVTFLSTLPFIKRSKMNILGAEGGIVDMSAYYTKDFTKEDAENMVANMNEAAYLLSLMLMHFAVKIAIEEDEEDDSMRKAALNFALNQLLRAERDILMWVSPKEFVKTFSAPVPIFSVVTSLAEAGATITDAVWTSEYYVKHGLYRGDNRILRSFASITPGAAQLKRFYDSTRLITENATGR